MARSLLKLGWRIARSNVTDARLPFKLTLILTYRCQLRCTMCNIWQRRPTDELTVDEIRAFFRKQPRFSWVNVSGGEIFLRSDIQDVFAAITEESRDLYVIDFPTHGQQTERIEAATRQLVGTRVPRIFVTVSVDGPPALHDEIRGVEGSFDKAMETFARLRKIRRRGYRPFLGMTLQAKNVDAFDDLLAAARRRIPDLHAREIHVNLSHESGHYYDNIGLEPLDADRASAAMAAIREHRGTSLHPVAWLERRYQSLADRYLRTGRTPVPCHAAASSIFVDSFGVVRPCTIYDKPLGSLRDHDFDLESLFDAAGIRDVRADIRRGNCPHCWTPCEAYQTLLANLLPKPRRRLADPIPLASPGASTPSAADPNARAHAPRSDAEVPTR